nr:MAG TPA: hypothetical protein [Caudoviricetes sp.]
MKTKNILKLGVITGLLLSSVMNVYAVQSIPEGKEEEYYHMVEEYGAAHVGVDEYGNIIYVGQTGGAGVPSEYVQETPESTQDVTDSISEPSQPATEQVPQTEDKTAETSSEEHVDTLKDMQENSNNNNFNIIHTVLTVIITVLVMTIGILVTKLFKHK